METLGRLAATVAHRLVLVDPRPWEFHASPGARPDAPPDRAGREAVASEDTPEPGDLRAGSLAAAWHDLALDELWWRLDSTRVPAVTAAGNLRLRRNTVSESRHARASTHGTWVSLPVIYGLAELVKLRLSAQPLDRPWPRAGWERLGSP